MLTAFLIILLQTVTPIASAKPIETTVDSLVVQLSEADYQEKLEILEKLCKHYALESPEQTIAYAHQLLHHAESRDNLSYMDIATSFLGEAYFFMDRPKDSEKYFLYLQDINKRQNDTLGLGSAFNNLAILYSSQKQFEKALKFYHKSLEIKIRLKDFSGMSTTYNNIGVAYFRQEQYKHALEYYQRSFELEYQLKNAEGIATSYLNMGEVKGKLHRDKEAIHDLNKSIQIADSINDPITKEYAHSCLYELYKSRKKFAQALMHYEQLSLLKSERLNERNNRQIAELQIQYETKKKQEKIAFLNKQQTRHRTVIIIQLVLFLLVLVLLWIVLRLLKTKTKISKQLQKQNTKIKEQHRTLQNANATKDRFFSIIAHDLKGAIGGFLGQTQFISEDFTHLQDREKIDMLNILHNSAQHLYTLLENLLAWSRSQLGNIEYHPEPINIATLLEEVIALNEGYLKEKHITVNYTKVNHAIVLADYNMLSTVLRNLLSNAIKYSYKGGEIILSSEYASDSQMIKVNIQDKGKGITPKRQEQLFSLAHTTSELGTNKEKGTGLGLILCKEFIKRNKGTIGFHSNPDAGTRFYFELPLFRGEAKQLT